MGLRCPRRWMTDNFICSSKEGMYLDLTNHTAVCSRLGFHRSELRLGFDRLGFDGYVTACAEGELPTTNPDF